MTGRLQVNRGYVEGMVEANVRLLPLPPIPAVRTLHTMSDIELTLENFRYINMRERLLNEQKKKNNAIRIAKKYIAKCENIATEMKKLDAKLAERDGRLKKLPPKRMVDRRDNSAAVYAYLKTLNADEKAALINMFEETK